MKQGIAFVTFSSVETAVLAKDALEGVEVAGRNIHINFAEEVLKRNAGKRPPPSRRTR